MPIPKITKQNRGRGQRGAAIFEKLSDEEIQITFRKTGDTFVFPNDDERVYTDVDLFNSSIEQADVYAQISKDETKLFAVRPMTGSFFVKVDGFASPKDQPPSPRSYEGMARKDDGTSFKYSFEGFTVLLKIQKGEWQDTIIPSMLRYYFMDAGDGNSTGIKTTGKYSQQLAQFLDFAGLDFDNDTIPLSENVLPWLEKTLTDRNKTFMIVVEDGYVSSFAPAPEGM